MYKIYKYTFPNGKIYIGKTKNSIEQRAGHNGCKYGMNTLVGRAIHKYGWINVVKEILVDDLTEQEANKEERRLIKQYNSTDKSIGYNLTRGGDGGVSVYYKMSDETKQKIGQKNRISLKGRKLSKEHIEKMRNTLSGHIVTEETRKKIRKANIGRKHTDEERLKISMNNKSSLPEVREKISNTVKEKSEIIQEKRRKTIQERYGGWFSQNDESNKKRSEKMKGVKKSDKTRQKMRKPKSPEAIENMRKAQQRRRELTRIGGSGR